jgi:ferric-dicitrate binding protein FerR (iron transport regulator)
MRAEAHPSPRSRRHLAVELGVGVLLIALTLLALAAGGAIEVSTAADGGTGSTERPTLVLQCPLGVHRLSAP